MLDELKKILFPKSKVIKEEHLTTSFNSKLICAVETEKYVILFANELETRIKRPIILEKESGKLLLNKHLKNRKIIKKVYFSLFLGFLNYKGAVYLIFVDKVKNILFGKCNIFDISSISVFNLKNFMPQIDLSQVLTEYYKMGFMFSFDIDLSDSGNYLNAFKNDSDTFKYRMNFIFFANRYLISICVNQGFKSWAISVVYGRLQREVLKTSEDNTQMIYFVYKESVLNINPLYREDNDLLQDFYCPTSFSSIDTFIMEDGYLRSFGITFNDFPGCTNLIKSKNKADYFMNNISHKKVSKYYQFMNCFLHSNNFVFSGEKDKVNLMNGVKEYFKTDKSLKRIVKNLIFLKTDYYSDLIYVAEVIADRIDSFDLLFDETEENSKAPYISFCSERPVKDFEECFFIMYSNFMRDYKKRKKSIQLRKKRGSFESIKINSYTDNVLTNFKKNIKTLFSNIQYSKSILEEVNSFLKTNLKEYNIKPSIPKIIMNLYGSKNNISKSYKKILNNTLLPVFKTKEIKMAFITHNCGGEFLNENTMHQIYYNKIAEIKNSDIVVIGLQEIIEMKSKNWTKIISSDNKISLEPWVETLARCFPDFTILTHVSMVGLFLMILVKNTSLNLFDISVHDKELIKLGFMKLANKGAIFIKLKIDYETIGIFNCHLAAGVRTKDFEKRKENLNVLIDYLYKHNDLSSTFIMGDMNFRTKTTCERASKLIDFYIEQAEPKKHSECIQTLLKTDELTYFKEQNEDNKIQEFKEMRINFLPSYKWEINGNTYNYQNGKKTPSW